LINKPGCWPGVSTIPQFAPRSMTKRMVSGRGE
jgi:hypothetical protein